jgi:basic membrane protein A and related proteins
MHRSDASRFRSGRRTELRALMAAGVAVLIFAGLTLAGGLSATAANSTPKATFKVAALSVGAKDDTRWGESWYNGLVLAKKKYGIQFQFAGNVNTLDQYLAQGGAFAAAGYDLVFLAHGGSVDVGRKLAKQFPKTVFCLVDEPGLGDVAKDPPNLCRVDTEQGQSAFLAGVVAGLVTKTNSIGAVTGFAFPALTRQPEGFALGARCVNSKVKFKNTYINSFTDVAFGRAAALALMQKGADIIYSATDDATEGVYAAARTKPGTYVIPQYYDSHKSAPDVVLTTNLFDMDKVEADVIGRAVKGLPSHFYRRYTVGQGFGGIAPFYQFKTLIGPANLKTIQEITQKVKKTQIKVPLSLFSKPSLGNPGGAAKVNVRAIGCKPVR